MGSGSSPDGSNAFVSLNIPTMSRQVSHKKKYGDSTDFVKEVSNTDISDFGPKMEGLGSFLNKGSSAIESWKAKRDELNLSGLLNVLDGVVDTPGRMLVMTTNHPELLDPALIRPGRIDKKLLLGYLGHEDLANMVQHYFQIELTEEQAERIKNTINTPPTLKLTPAEVEQMACEHDDIESMITAVEEMKKLQLMQDHPDQIVFNS